jgi:hypothetical protein
LKRAVLLVVVFVTAGLSLLSCGGSSRRSGPPSGVTTRLMVSQEVTSGVSFAGLILLNGTNDTLVRASEISGGNTPTILATSPTKTRLLAFDSNPNSLSVQVIDTTRESNIGRIGLLGPATSLVMTDPTSTGYAAVPTAPITGYPPGAVELLNVNTMTALPIGVPGAQYILPNSNGAQLLVFSNDSDSISVLSPLLAAGPVDQGCDTAPNTICTVVPGFNRPVFGVMNGSSAYILNCGFECNGSQPASVQLLDLSTTPPTPGASVPVDGATVALLQGSTLYVAGNSPTDVSCTGQTTAATTCGRLDVVDINSMTVTTRVAITDGYHDHIDISPNGQLFIGARTCTEIGNVNHPSGEVRGCLSIFDTTMAGNTSAIIPPDNGDVTGMQSFTRFEKIYLVQGGTLKIYDTTTDKLLVTNIVKNGTIVITGKLVDVKAIDFF